MKNLLVIDDSKAVAMALKSQLDPEVYQVTATLSADEGLMHLESEMFDCVLCDYDMPGTDGPGFCEAMKKNERFRHIPVIMLTSNDSTDHLLKALNAGADDFLSKNSDIRIVLAKIQAMIRVKETTEELTRMKHVAGIRKIVTTYNHEFNNPLTIAIGNLNHLRQDLTDQIYSARIERIWSALARMSEIVRKIREIRDYVDTSYANNEDMIAVKKDC